MTYSLGSPPGGTLTAAGAATDDKFPIVDTSAGAVDAANKTITVAEAKTLLAPSFASTTPAIVQYKKTSSTRSSSTQSFTLDASPTVGNLLIFFETGFSDSVLTIPTGWSPMFDFQRQVSSQMARALYRVVQSGDSTSYSFSADGNPKNSIMIEVSGWHGWEVLLGSGAQGANQALPSVSRGIASKLVLWGGEADGNHSSVSLSSGNTKLADFVDGSTNHSGFFGKFDTVLTLGGATVAATCVATWNTSATTPISVALVILGQPSIS